MLASAHSLEGRSCHAFQVWLFWWTSKSHAAHCLANVVLVRDVRAWCRPNRSSLEGGGDRPQKGRGHWEWGSDGGYLCYSFIWIHVYIKLISFISNTLYSMRKYTHVGFTPPHLTPCRGRHMGLRGKAWGGWNKIPYVCFPYWMYGIYSYMCIYTHK